MAEPLVSILIVTWNRSAELPRSIESALAQTYRNIEIIVVDNGSSDGTAEMVTERYPHVQLIRSTTNLGCPSGRNFGFTHCRGTYIYQLDDDGWLHEDAVAMAVQRAEADPSIAVVSSKICEVEGTQVVREIPAVRQPVYQHAFIGCCSMLRRAALDAAGGYAEDFFRQAEEEDLAIRLLDHEYLCLLEPASVMYHRPSQQGRDLKAFLYYSLRNTNKTGLRSWPFPWCLARPLVNMGHAFRYMLTMRDLSLPLRVLTALLGDLCTLPGKRKPVRGCTFTLYRQLQQSPSPTRPPLATSASRRVPGNEMHGTIQDGTLV